MNAWILVPAPLIAAPLIQVRDFNVTREFLRAYTGSNVTFMAYRRDVERLLLWSWFIAGKVLEDLRCDDIETFIGFCQQPPKACIGVKKVARFAVIESKRRPNPEWRPFVATVSKSAFKKGQKPDKANYSASNTAIKQILSITGSFFQYLQLEEYMFVNPVAMIRQKSKFVLKRQGQTRVRRLSQQQWQTVIDTVTRMADHEPQRHERTLFIISVLYGMYLRISELAASDRWTTDHE